MTRLTLAILAVAFVCSSSAARAGELVPSQDQQKELDRCVERMYKEPNFGSNYHICVVQMEGVYRVAMMRVSTLEVFELPSSKSPVEIVDGHDTKLLVYHTGDKETAYLVGKDGSLIPQG
jgi:hypothetical protein